MLVIIVVLAVVLIIAFSDCGGTGGGSAGGTGAVSPSASPRPSVTPTVRPSRSFIPSADRPLRLKNYGDSMGGELGVALAPLLRPLATVKYWTYYKVSSSLTRPDFFDWPAHLRDDLPHRYLHAAVWMVGTNDGQGMTTSAGVLPFGSAAWKAEYARRVAEVLGIFEQQKVRRVYWVGMPIMRDPAFSSVMRTINAVARREAAKHAGVVYIDAWKLFSTSSGSYDARWRQSDGVHFNIDGQNRLAAAVMARIEADWRLSAS